MVPERFAKSFRDRCEMRFALPSRPSVAGPFLVSNRDREHTVHGQRGDCRTADTGHTEDLTGDLGDEVVAPYVEPGMEELCRIAGCRIDGGGTCSFSQRTRYARERQVLERRHAAGSLRHDVIQVERGFLAELRDPTVLASLVRPQPRSALQRDGDVPAAHPGAGWRFDERRRSSVSRSARSTSPSASACSSALSAVPPSCLSRSACNRRSSPSGSCSRARSPGTSISKSTFALVLTG